METEWPLVVPWLPLARQSEVATLPARSRDRVAGVVCNRSRSRIGPITTERISPAELRTRSSTFAASYGELKQSQTDQCKGSEEVNRSEMIVSPARRPAFQASLIRLTDKILAVSKPSLAIAIPNESGTITGVPFDFSLRSISKASSFTSNISASTPLVGTVPTRDSVESSVGPLIRQFFLNFSNKGPDPSFPAQEHSIAPEESLYPSQVSKSPQLVLQPIARLDIHSKEEINSNSPIARY